MRLAEFIVEKNEVIAQEWENFARTLMPEFNSERWRDHIHLLLRYIVKDMESNRSIHQCAAKDGDPEAGPGSPAESHAVERVEEGFTITELASEFHALRATIVRLWHQTKNEMDEEDIEHLVRFNAALDRTMSESLKCYIQETYLFRDMFLGILAHDLRNPLGAILNSAELLERADCGPREAALSHQIVISALRMERMITDLLELTRVRLGKGIVIQPEPVDMERVAGEVLAEMKALYSDREIILKMDGDLTGRWDGARLSQVLSNLIGNAVQHGTANAPVTVRMEGGAERLVMKIHNEGPPIPKKDIGNIFDSFVQSGYEEEKSYSKSLGLGLFISKEIVLAHGGTIEVRSNAEEGTTFVACIPRNVKE